MPSRHCLSTVTSRAQIRGMIEIRAETPQDWKAVYAVVSSAFGQTDEAELDDELRRAGDVVVSLVAVEDGQIIGQVLLSRMDAPFPALALAPLAVIATARGRGIGSGLVQTAINHARMEGWAAIFVLGDPGYYQRFGFDQEAAAGFNSPYAGSHFMMLKLTPSLPVASGELRHAPAFAALG